MGFLFGVMVFVIVIGWLDTRLPWPRPGKADQ
jgi:hypothetical protein